MTEFQHGADRVEGGGAVTGIVPVTAAPFLDVAIDTMANALERVLPDMPAIGLILALMLVLQLASGGAVCPDVAWSSTVDDVAQVATPADAGGVGR